MRFKDRMDAGEHLADLIKVNNPQNTVVLALPRGGIPLGICVSKKCQIPLDVVLAKKIGHPMQPEFAIGAVAEGGEPILNTDILVEPDWINHELKDIRKETKRRRKLYDEVIKKQTLKGKDVIIVDDGIATGMTMFAAIEAVKEQEPNRVTVAVPIMPRDTFKQIEDRVEEVISIEIPEQFLGAVGAYYEDFPQISDQEVQELLENHKT